MVLLPRDYARQIKCQSLWSDNELLAGGNAEVTRRVFVTVVSHKNIDICFGEIIFIHSGKSPLGTFSPVRYRN